MIPLEKTVDPAVGVSLKKKRTKRRARTNELCLPPGIQASTGPATCARNELVRAVHIATASPRTWPTRHNDRDISRVFLAKKSISFAHKSLAPRIQSSRLQASSRVYSTLQQHQLESLRVIFIVTTYRALSAFSVPLPSC
jgi:hypothetical protein